MNDSSEKNENAPVTGHHTGEQSWLERNVNTVIVVLIVACVLTALAQLVFGLGFDDHHPPHFEEETWFGFQAIFGFVAFIVVVFLGSALRMIVARPEDYYDA